MKGRSRLKQHLDNLRRKDSLTGAATTEISVRLANDSASHFEGSAPSSGVYSRILCHTPSMEGTAMEHPCIDDGGEGTHTTEEITCDTGTFAEGCWGALPA
jgi:hypothetical protein